MLKSLLRRVVAALGLSIFIGASAVPAATAPAVHIAHPALWAVSDADTTIYLFGTIHLLPSDYKWRTPKFDQAVAGSQQLVVETIVDENNPQEMMAALASLAFSPGLPPLVDRVPPAKRPALEAAMKKSGLPVQAFDKMETWAAAFMLLGNQFREMGLKNGEGVETVLRNAFKSQGKSIGELESNKEQLSFFDKLPEPAQRALLEGAIEDNKAMGSDFSQMLSAWARGDVNAIAKSFNRDLSSSPELKQALLERRNANWSHWVEQRMASPGAVMVAVGAGHLAGNGSLVDLLKRQGYKVRRLQ
ncbi:MAG TPA: TraB/GumN family protein [Sphingomicrobium sp.]